VNDAAAGPLVFLAACEPSGDVLGARLMAALRRRTGGRIRFAGVGGARMAAEGLASLFPVDDLAVLGIVEVVPRIPLVLRRMREAARAAAAASPAAIVTIDSPAFAFGFLKRVAGHDAPRIHYVAPTVWAWRPWRVRKFARTFDRLLALLPFEPPFFARVGLPCDFVGHPVLESGADKGDGAAFRGRHGIPADVPLLCVLPGSRAGEVRRLLPHFAAAVAVLRTRFPSLRIVLPTVSSVAAAVSAQVAGWPVAVTVVEGDDDKYGAMAASTAALAASGTVALELALAGTPAVIAYRLSPLTWAVVNRLVRVEYANLVNLLLDRPAVPELLQGECRADRLADEIGRLMESEKLRDAQRQAARAALAKLGAGDAAPSDKAADAVLAAIEQWRQSGRDGGRL
jgi:lipid-A-disaccharide synthase